MDWLPLESRALASVAYAESERTLYLRFKSGEIYRYFRFPPEQYQEFLAADSKGQYFAAHVRDQFQCERLPRARGTAGF
ncbi:MAG TPA: KTSC domain-containing protein [Bryobacteraceae bacterium]